MRISKEQFQAYMHVLDLGYRLHGQPRDTAIADEDLESMDLIAAHTVFIAAGQFLHAICGIPLDRLGGDLDESIEH